MVVAEDADAVIDWTRVEVDDDDSVIQLAADERIVRSVPRTALSHWSKPS